MASEASAIPPDKRETRPQRVIGRYALHDEIASGGMAVVHFGRLLGPVGFARSVAIKRLHAHFAKDPEFVAMFLDEARLAARIRHPNVVPTIDVVALQGELFLVMEYVQGDTVARLIRAAARKDARVPVPIAVSIIVGALHGLHSAHEARSERGQPLGIIHRDVSPQNILVGEDGVARIVDFGIAKASWRLQSTQEGQLKGKLPYMAPEQLREEPVDRRVDVYAAAVVLWELLAGRRLFDATNPLAAIEQMISKQVQPPSKLATGVSPSLDKIVLKGLARDRHGRYETAREMAIALEEASPMATARQVGDWVTAAAGDVLRRRAEVLSGIEHGDEEAIPAPAADAVIPELPATELSTSKTDVTVAGAIQPAASPARWRASLGLAGAALLSILSLALWFGLRGPPREHAAPVTAVPAAVEPAPVATAIPTSAPVAEIAAAPETTAAPSATPERSSAPPPTPAAAPEEARSSPPPRPAVRTVPTATAAPRLPGLVRDFPDDPPTVAHKPNVPASSSTGAAATKVNCKPPYTVDAEGVRVPKPGCY